MVARSTLFVALVACLLTAVPRGTSSAQGSIDPSRFAAPASAFPPVSQVLESRVASNVDVELQHLQIGPEMPDTRLTGYYMRARTTDAASGAVASTYFLASIFTTADGASAAFQGQDAYWRTLAQSQGVTVTLQPLPGHIGDLNARWYQLRNAEGLTHTELFFQRKQFFIEVNGDTYSGPAPGSAYMTALFALGTYLDGVAVALSQGLAASPTPTVTPIPTATSVPTATRVSPTATSIPTATPTRAPTRVPSPTLVIHKPVQEPKACPKGQKRVKGKCVKKP